MRPSPVVVAWKSCLPGQLGLDLEECLLGPGTADRLRISLELPARLGSYDHRVIARGEDAEFDLPPGPNDVAEVLGDADPAFPWPAPAGLVALTESDDEASLMRCPRDRPHARAPPASHSSVHGDSVAAASASRDASRAVAMVNRSRRRSARAGEPRR